MIIKAFYNNFVFIIILLLLEMYLAFNYQIVDMLSKPFNEASVKSVIEKTIMFKGMEQY